MIDESLGGSTRTRLFLASDVEKQALHLHLHLHLLEPGGEEPCLALSCDLGSTNTKSITLMHRVTVVIHGTPTIQLSTPMNQSCLM